jgi:undecaprenyl-diphosphatase
MPHVAFVINRTLDRDLGRFRRRCGQAAEAAGWEPLFLETRRDETGPGLTRRAVTAGTRLVFAAGGDGTVRACAQALTCTDVPLAIVPLGTANLAARALGVPLRADAALAVGFAGRNRRVDVGLADGVAFTAMAGMGLDAAVVGATPRILKERLGWLAYGVTGIARLPGRRHKFTVLLDDGQPIVRHARSVVVGNAGLLPGGFVLLPDAQLDDGVLDVGILAPSDPLGWARVTHRVLASSRRTDRHLERCQARRIEIRADVELPREVDGEAIVPSRSLTVSVRQGALLVRVPSW